MHKRIINFRGFLISGITLMVVILLCYHIFSSFAENKTNAFTYIEIVFLIIIFLAVLFFMVFLWIKKGFDDKVLTFLFTFVTCSIAVGLIFQSFASWIGPEFIDDTFVGRVENSAYKTEYNYYVVTLDDVSTKEQSLQHKVLLYIESSEDMALSDYEEKYQIGKLITFNAILEKSQLDGYSYNSDIAYTAYLEDGDIELIGITEINFIEKIQKKLHSVLVENLGYEMGELSYSMLTGDKNNLASEIKDGFSLSGLGHILAVSGLHIGFIASALAWIMKKLKVNKYINLAVTAFFILFYCFLAGFSGSVVRAGIMTIIGLIAVLSGNNNDLLNTLFFAISAILTFRPLLLLYVGFLMSVVAVLGIIIFSPSIARFFSKIKFPKFLSDAISVTLSATISIMPITIFYFKFISPYSIITNLIVLPFIGVFFVAILITSILTMLMPFMAVLLKVSSLGLALVNELVKLVSKIPGASVPVYGGIILLLIYLLYFIGSRFVMKGKAKYPIIIACIILSFTLILKPNIYQKRSNEVIFFGNGINVQSIISDKDNNTYFIGDFGGYQKLKEVMNICKIRKFNGIYLTSFSASSAYNLKRYLDSFPETEIYLPIDPNIEGLKILIKEGIDFNTFEQEYDFGNGLRACYDKDDFECYIYDNGQEKYAFYPKYTYKFSENILNEVQVIRTTFIPEKIDNDILFLINKKTDSYLSNAYFADTKIYSIKTDDKTLNEIKSQIW